MYIMKIMKDSFLYYQIFFTNIILIVKQYEIAGWDMMVEDGWDKVPM